MISLLIYFLPIIGLWVSLPVISSVVDTVEVRSKKMNRDIPCVVITPDRMTGGFRCPVLYLLHGYSAKGYRDSHKVWVDNIKTELPRIADRYGMIIVCPNGENSWYWDSPKDKNSRFETFISKELIKYVDDHYYTVADRDGRAITGSSMGGHGALWLAIRHQDVFGAAGSMSGGVDIRSFPDKWNIHSLLGDRAKNKKVWDKHMVISQLNKLKNGNLALIIDCGCDDFFLSVNSDLHRRLLEQKIDHDYIIRPGGHTWSYWNNSIDYQILFFSNFFCKNRLNYR